MFDTLEQAAEYVRERGIVQIDLKFCDLNGRWRHVTLPAGNLGPRLMERGVGFDGSSVGFKSVHSGDMVLVPDLSSGFLDPFWELPTLSFIGTTLEADTRAEATGDPRLVARRAEEFLRRSGVGDRSLWGPEFEFYLFDGVSWENGVNAAARTGSSRPRPTGAARSWARATPSRCTAATTPSSPRTTWLARAPASASTSRPWTCRSSTTTTRWAGRGSARSRSGCCRWCRPPT